MVDLISEDKRSHVLQVPVHLYSCFYSVRYVVVIVVSVRNIHDSRDVLPEGVSRSQPQFCVDTIAVLQYTDPDGVVRESCHRHTFEAS